MQGKKKIFYYYYFNYFLGFVWQKLIVLKTKIVKIDLGVFVKHALKLKRKTLSNIISENTKNTAQQLSHLLSPTNRHFDL
jgi:hypothetical protein